MKIFKLLLLVLTIGAVLPSCKKEANPLAGTVTNKTSTTTATTTTVPVYTFSSPQMILDQVYRPGTYSTSSHFIAALQQSSYFFDLSVVSTADYSYKLYSVTSPLISDGLFRGTLDLEEKSFFVVSNTNHILYRYDLTTKILNKVTSGFGQVSTIKSLGSNEVMFTSDSLHGSLIKVSNAGTKTILARSLGYPGSFCSYNGQYFVVNSNIVNGSVLNVSGTGVVSTLISNLTEPTKITVDLNGTLILEDQVTLGGSPFRVYELYTSTGLFVKRMTDDAGKIIVSFKFLQSPNAEMYVDGFNNLFFFHNALGGADYSYPATTHNGIWKIQLIKQ